MTFRWIENDIVEQLLADLHQVRSGTFDFDRVAAAPQLSWYKPVMGKAFALSGVVSGHPRLADGRQVITSQLFYLDEDHGLARTMNRWYRLHSSSILNQGH